MILIDTNVLVYAVQGEAVQHEASRRFVEEASGGRFLACLLPQILLEFYAVITDPKRMDCPASTAEGLDLAGKYSAMFPVLQPSPTAMNIVLSLVADRQIHGQRVFDTYLVAQMMDLGVEGICTYNKRDFSGYPVMAQTPEETLNYPSINPNMVHDKPSIPR